MLKLMSAGHSAFSGGTGAEAGKLFEHTPDGEIFEVKREGNQFARVRKVEQRSTTG